MQNVRLVEDNETELTKKKRETQRYDCFEVAGLKCTQSTLAFDSHTLKTLSYTRTGDIKCKLWILSWKDYAQYFFSRFINTFDVMPLLPPYLFGVCIHQVPVMMSVAPGSSTQKVITFSPFNNTEKAQK
jgi:hypothetical protein